MIQWGVAAAVLSILATGVAAEQPEQPTLHTGDRVRLRLTRGTVTGRVVERTADEVRLHPDEGAADRTLPWTTVREVERYQGTYRPVALLMLLGGSGGAGAGLTLDWARGLASFGCEHDCPPDRKLRLKVAVVGALAGGLIGAVVRLEDWAPVRRGAWGLTLSPAIDDGVAATVRFRF